MLLVSLLVLTVSSTFAQYTYTASGRLIQAQEALIQRSGSYAFFSRTDFNFLPDAYRNNGIPVAHSLVRTSLHADYSLLDNVQFGLNAMLYQDINHRDKFSSFLNNVTLVGKVGSISLFSDNIYAGLLLSVMVPTGGNSVWNSYGNPYSAGGVEYSGNVLLSYYLDEIFPQESISFTANFGFYNFNDVGGNLANVSDRELLNQGASTTSLNYAIGAKIPFQNFDLMLEYWGWSFATEPPVNAYTRLNASFLSAAMKFRTSRSFSITLGFEYRVGGGSESTTVLSPINGIVPRPSAITGVPYTNWRGILGFEMNFPTFRNTTYSGGSGGFDEFSDGQVMPSSQDSYSLIRKIQEIDEDKETIARKIEEFRRRRQGIEANLEQIRRALNESKKPVEEAPAPSPAPAPETPAPTPAPSPAPETPAPTPAPSPAPETPAPTPAPSPAPETPAPTPAPSPAPETPAPTPAPSPTPTPNPQF
ncbi:MAG: hypothetical protein SFU91_00440 [Chloroherpetonaceae bacterium]|nr:hypothetical protein [Chloroherpetonaceae bacterium]